MNIGSFRRYSFLIAPVCTVVIAVFLGFILFGGIGIEGEKIVQYLVAEKAYTKETLEQQLGNVSLQGIMLSQTLTKNINEILKNRNLAFSELSGNDTDLNYLLESELNQLLLALERTRSSGVFFIINATVNPLLPDAFRSRAGLYIQNTEPLMPGANSQKLFLRGPAEFALHNGFGLQAYWDLEFNIEKNDYYNTLAELCKTQKDLARLYLWCFVDSINYPGKKTLLCSVPLVSPDGEFWGICGFEISEINFSQSSARSSEAYPDLGLNQSQSFALLAAADQNGILDLDRAFFRGISSPPEGKAEWTDEAKGLFRYSTEENSLFVGAGEDLRIYRGDTLHSEGLNLAILIPMQEYKRIIWNSKLRYGSILAALIIIGVGFSMYAVRRYIKKQEAEIQERLQALVKKPVNLDQYGLSPREKEICLLLLQGLLIKQISYELNIAYATVKTHCNTLYRKMEVSGRTELLVKITQ